MQSPQEQTELVAGMKSKRQLSFLLTVLHFPGQLLVDKPLSRFSKPLGVEKVPHLEYWKIQHMTQDSTNRVFDHTAGSKQLWHSDQVQ